MLLELAYLGKTDWQIENITDPIQSEFLVCLKRGGIKAANRLSLDELQSKRMLILKRGLMDVKVQLDWFLQKPDEKESEAVMPKRSLFSRLFGRQ